MQIGKFGAKIFEVSSSKILTFTDLSISGSLSASSEEAAQGKKPATKVKSPDLLKVSLVPHLNAALGADVWAEIDDWFAIKDAGKPYPLILCGKAVSLNMFLLKSCKAGDIEIVRAGGKPVMAAAKLTLEWVEYLPPGVQAAAAANAANAGGSGAVSINNAYNMPTAAEKADMKRTNTGMGG